TGRHRLLQSIEFYHGVAHRRARIEYDICEVAKFLAVGPLTRAGIAVDLADDGRDEDASLFKSLGDFDRHDVAAAAADHESAIDLLQIVVAQDAFGESADVLKEHRLPLAVGADDGVVEAQRKLHHRVKPWEAAVARPHLLDHDSAVYAAKQV